MNWFDSNVDQMNDCTYLNFLYLEMYEFFIPYVFIEGWNQNKKNAGNFEIDLTSERE